MTKLFIDPGHGGRDPGAVANGLQEKDLALDIALRLRDKLQGKAQVEMSRTTDTSVDLSERARMANNQGADYFVSIHVNAGGGTGFESFIHTSQASTTVENQNVMHDEIMAVLDVNDRGKKSANFAVLRETSMPAILTENMFIDHSDDAEKLKDDSFIDKIAEGHLRGLEEVFDLTGGFSFSHWDGSIIRNGDRGSRVEELQQRLVDLGYSLPRFGVDGIFGDETAAATRDFQSDAGIQVDGIPGPETHGALEG